MKKVISVLLSAIMLLSCFSFAAFANGEDPYQWQAWIQSNGGHFLDDYESYGANNYDMIPVSYDEETGRPIYQWDEYIGILSAVSVFRAKGIGDYAFYEAGEAGRLNPVSGGGTFGLRNIGIGESVKYIGKSAFENAQGKFRVDNYRYTPFGHELTNSYSAYEEIRERAFYNSGVYSIELPETLKVLGESAFQHTPYLTLITIPGSLEEISKNAFANSGLEKAVIEDGVKVIGEKAFANCENLKTVEILGSVDSIAEDAFENCPNVKFAVLSKTDAVIKNAIEGAVVYCFAGSAQQAYCKENAIAYKLFSDPVQCGDDAYISFDEETKALVVSGTGAMWNYDDDEQYKFFEEPGWYYYKDEIKNIRVEDGITAINPYIIMRLNFETITFGKSFDIDGLKDFNGASLFYRYVKEYSVSDENPYFKSVDGVIFSKDGKTLYSYPKNNDRKEYIIPDGVETISEYSFEYAYKLESVIMPEGVRNINNSAFMYSSDIKNVKMPSTLKYIGKFSFALCYNLNIELPEGAENLIIDDSAFASIKTQTIVIPEGVASVGEGNFILVTSPKNIINKSKTLVCSDYEFNFEEPYETICNDFYNNFYHYILDDENYSIFEDEIQIDLRTNAYFKAKNLVLEKFGEEYSALFDDEEQGFDYDVIEQYELPEDKRINTYLNIACLEDSAQHQYCIENNIKHTILNSNCDDACNIHNVYENEYIAPTCTENGYKGGKVCLDCEKIFEPAEVLPATGHTPVKTEGLRPTCTEIGFEDAIVCDVCGELLEDLKLIQATGHTDNNNDGICDTCGEKYEDFEPEPIPETLGQRIINFFKGIVDSILALFKKLFG